MEVFEYEETMWLVNTKTKKIWLWNEMGIWIKMKNQKERKVTLIICVRVKEGGWLWLSFGNLSENAYQCESSGCMFLVTIACRGEEKKRVILVSKAN